jgi:hypothetical protein
MLESYACSTRLMVCSMFYLMSNAQKPNFEETCCYICEMCVDIKHRIVAKLIDVISLFQIETYLK